MFKKLLVISLSTLILAGCGKEVTEDMLIGKWKCSKIIGSMAEYDKKGNLGEFKILNGSSMPPLNYTYQKDAGIMMIQFEQFKPVKFFFEGDPEFSVHPSHSELEVKISVDYIFISNDEFRKEYYSITRDIFSKRNLYDNKYGLLCTRVKD